MDESPQTNYLVASRLKAEHQEWRQQNFIEKKGFFPIFYGFKDYLNQLSGGAVSLFIYIGLNSNNKTGETYHDIDRIAAYFGRSPRTISSWFKELESIGLITRLQLRMNGVAHTFIKPYTPSSKDKEGITTDDGKD